MSRVTFILVFIFGSLDIFGQPNCEVLKEDQDCYKSCKTAMKAIRYSQGSYQSQSLFDASIEYCASFAYSYMEKGVPFLKRGQFVEWKLLIDKAVALSPSDYLGYRGWCRLQFLRDYQGAIDDIEELKNTVSYDIGFCQTGDYHLEVARAYCYKMIGQPDKALEILTGHVNSEGYSSGLYDFYQLGVLQYGMEDYEQAITSLKQQLEEYELAEPHYYLALAYKQLDQEEEYKTSLAKALELYKLERSLYDNYTEALDKIYLQDIVAEMEQGFASR